MAGVMFVTRVVCVCVCVLVDDCQFYWDATLNAILELNFGHYRRLVFLHPNVILEATVCPLPPASVHFIGRHGT